MAIINENQILKVLQQYNPWWNDSDSAIPQAKPQKRFAYYETLKVLNHRSLRRFPILSGLRRVGKTTILYQIIKHLLDNKIPAKNILYVTFDNPILKLPTIDELLELFQTYIAIDEHLFLFFDEIQYADNWELWLKVFYDSKPNITIISTGSASPVIDKRSSESGAGRCTTIKVPTLSFFEYCELLKLNHSIKLSNVKSCFDLPSLNKGELLLLCNQFESLQKHFNRYLSIGGFPELVLSNDDSYAQRMLREDVVDKVLKRDMPFLFNIRNPALLDKLFIYLCTTSSEIFNSQSTAKELTDVTIATLENYLTYLEKSNLIYISKPMDVGSKGALKGKPKIYISDAAIRNAVLMINSVQADEKELGVMVETAVYKHFISYYQNSNTTVGYFRKLKVNEKEVDVVAESISGKVLCEVKYRNNSVITKKDAIVELSIDSQNQIQYSFVLTKRIDDCGITLHDTAVPIIRVPALVFVYLLGMEEHAKLNQ